jgi:hypothetical protein
MSKRWLLGLVAPTTLPAAGVAAASGPTFTNPLTVVRTNRSPWGR